MPERGRVHILDRSVNHGQLQLPWKVSWGCFTRTDMKVFVEVREAERSKRRIQDELQAVRD